MSDILKKEIKFRGSRRGIKELDLIMSQFIDTQIDTLSDQELTFLRDVLLETDLDLLAYFQNEKPLPNHLDENLFNKIKAGYNF